MMTDSKDLEAQLQETKAQLNELAALINVAQEEKEAVNKEISAEHAKLNKLNSKSLEIRNKIEDFRRKMADAERGIKAAEQEVAREKENEKVRLEYQKQLNEYSELIEAAAWGDKAMPHQIDGAIKLAISGRGILGDKRGLGKTLTAIAFADLADSKKILAFVPNDVMGNFQREVNFWAPHRPIHIIGGLPKSHRKPLLKVFADVPEIFVVVNYEAWRKDLALLDQLVNVKFDTIIADEAHMIKDMGSIFYRGVAKLVKAENACPKCGSNNFGAYGLDLKCFNCQYRQLEFGEFRSAKKFVPMTGTPILNKPQDMFPLLHLVNEQLFPDQSSYLRTYCERGYDGKWRFQLGGEERLASRISAFYVARNRDQAGVKIPKQEVQLHELELTPEEYPLQYEAYQILTKRSAMIMDDLLADEENKGIVPVLYKIALITRQRQMMTWPAGIKLRDPKTKHILFESEVRESIKVDKIIDRFGQTGLGKDIVEDEGDRLVIFSQFKEPLEELERRFKLAGIKAVRYDGSTPNALKQEIQIDFDRKFQDESKPYKWDVVLANYKSGGVGLNLNAATQTIILDEEWNPGKVDQAYGRTDRIGQTEESIVHVLRVKSTIDTWLAKLIESKSQMIGGFEQHIDMEQELLDILRGIKPNGV